MKKRIINLILLSILVSVTCLKTPFKNKLSYSISAPSWSTCESATGKKDRIPSLYL